MKKLIIVALLAVFTLACTNSGIEDDSEIQVIDKEKLKVPSQGPDEAESPEPPKNPNAPEDDC